MEKNWLGGDCWDMGLALAKETKLPLHGLYDEHGTCHHALVYDATLNLAIDGRGAMPIDRLKKGCAGQILKPLTREDIERAGGWLGRPIAKEEIAAASRYIKKHNVLRQWHMRQQLSGVLAAAAGATPKMTGPT